MHLSTEQATLFGIGYSPWTEKARWALDYCRLPYRYREHLILLGTPELRVRTGKLTGDLTVPALVHGRRRLFDSFDIAQYADQTSARSDGQRLFPTGFEDKIQEFNALSEEGLDAGRALAIAELRRNREALIENVPPFVPKPLAPALMPLVGLGLRYIKHEFEIDENARSRDLDRLHSVLTRIAQLLRSSGGQYALGRFTHGDIALAAVLHWVEPGSPDYVPLGPATRACWTHPELKREFAHLLGWRKSLYENHRRDANKSTNGDAFEPKADSSR